MYWFRFVLAPRLRLSKWWKLLLIDIFVAIVFVAAVTIPVYFLQPKQRFATATLLLVCLIILLFLAQKGGPRAAILSAVLFCVTCDFFLLRPTFSLWLIDSQDAIDLCIFLLVVILASGIIAQHRKIAQQAKHLNELESMRFEARLEEQRTEVIRRDNELRAIYGVMYLSRDRKDLKAQLKQMAQTIADTFHFCGVRGCAFYLFDLEGDASMWMLASRSGNMPELSHDDEASVVWVIQHGQQVTLPDLPLVSHAQSSYLRRVVVNRTDSQSCTMKCNYLVPLISGGKTLAVMRLYIEENAHEELAAMKCILRGETTPTGIHAELFLKLRDETVNMIEQSLIERALSLRQELQKRTEELQSSIISSVSHDFHTPLTQIMGAASGLLNRSSLAEDEEASREALRSIVGEAERLQRIVGKMLALSRVEYGAIPLKRELYPIETIILNALNQGHMRSLKQGRRIDIRVPDDVPPVELDPDLIGQVFTNLIENAIHYTPAESPIEISVQEHDRRLYITVADYGRGIPAEELELVFKRFHRIKQGLPGDATREPEQGSGLGLAVCQGFVQAHGGRIWAENSTHGGAKFNFTLPLHPTEGVTREKNFAG